MTHINPFSQIEHFQKGFTLVEILVALALFAILMAVVTSTMTGILGVNRNSQQRLSSTSNVQQVVETIKASWSAPNPGPQPKPTTPAWEAASKAFEKSKVDYANICVAMPGGALPAGVTVQVQGLDERGGNPGTAAALVVNNCPTTLPSGVPDMRRITVKSTDADKKTVTIVLDLVNPGRL